MPIDHAVALKGNTWTQEAELDVLRMHTISISN